MGSVGRGEWEVWGGLSGEGEWEVWGGVSGKCGEG